MPFTGGELSRFDAEWIKTRGPADDIPDGVYDAVIEAVRLSETRSTGRPVVIWTIRIEGPRAVNRVVRKNKVISERTLPFLKDDLEKCGLRISRLSELGGRLDEMTGRPVQIERRTKGGRVNFYFRWPARRC
jgi:hypothetical protein